MKNETTYYEIPVPDDLTKIRRIHDGKRWLNGVKSVTVDHGILTFTLQWGRDERRMTIASDIVGGYECDV